MQIVQCACCGKEFKWDGPPVHGIACDECFARLEKQFGEPVERLLSNPAIQAAIESDEENGN